MNDTLPTWRAACTPHRDIREDAVAEALFAVNLSRAIAHEGPTEYRDPQRFFERTHLTRALQSIVRDVLTTLGGEPGASTAQTSVVHLQTNFGGGKTHAELALYHLLTAAGPNLILIDELLHYVDKAAAVRVGDSNLATQTLAFLRELTEAVDAAPASMLVASFTMSKLEELQVLTEDQATFTLAQLEDILRRLENTCSPIEGAEIYDIVRTRLFQEVDASAAADTAAAYADFYRSEQWRDLLPQVTRESDYELLLRKAYPFHPSIIKVLYERWGSRPQFQLTRGTLRFLSHLLAQFLADVDLADEDVRGETIRVAGSAWEAVIGADIAATEPGDPALAEGHGRVLIASSQEDELSFAGKPYSAFTLALIEALAGQGVAKQDGFVRVADVALHAREVVPGRTKDRQHPILHFEHADNFALATYAGGATKPKGLPFPVASVEIEPEPGAWQGINQPGQSVSAPQTNIAGNVDGPVLSGKFDGPVAVGGGEAVSFDRSQGAIYKPSGPVRQHFGDSTDVNGNNNITGNRNTSIKVEQSHTEEPSLEAFRQLLQELQSALQTSGVDPDIAETALEDVRAVERQTDRETPNRVIILAKLNSVLGLLATADGVWGLTERLSPLVQQAMVWAQQLF
ncbi:MAG: DUF499 domain-containing protein [Chloroflexi bacterium]|nr:DUF499 domain-containing protein [Chloroflexota bacterium]